MKTVAVIAEYNPFHNGHRYHLQSIRDAFGDDTSIIVIMSGNYTQRGDVAIADKGTRAACAIVGGANLVLELPFPYSMAAAELFAKAGVHIANALGCVDILSFGSEHGEIDALRTVARNLDSVAFRRTFTDVRSSCRSLGHAKAMEQAYTQLYGVEQAPFPTTPNDLLGLEYLRAIDAAHSPLQPHTVLRRGASHHTSMLSDDYPSATALRAHIRQGGSLTSYMPSEAATILADAIAHGYAPCDGEKLFPAVLSTWINTPKASDIHDVGGGLYDRLRRCGAEATSLTSWVTLSETKKYTRARLRRALWYAYFGVTSSDIMTAPGYTQLLGADALGRHLLKRMRKETRIPILTKPADTAVLSEEALRQKQLSDKADRMFALTRAVPMAPASALRFTPYLKK